MTKIIIDGPDQFLYQWDQGQRLILYNAPEKARVDFAVCGDDKALSRYTYEENGVTYCDIPDSMLTNDIHLANMAGGMISCINP